MVSTKKIWCIKRINRGWVITILEGEVCGEEPPSEEPPGSGGNENGNGEDNENGEDGLNEDGYDVKEDGGIVPPFG